MLKCDSYEIRCYLTSKRGVEALPIKLNRCRITTDRYFVIFMSELMITSLRKRNVSIRRGLSKHAMTEYLLPSDSRYLALIDSFTIYRQGYPKGSKCRRIDSVKEAMQENVVGAPALA